MLLSAETVKKTKKERKMCLKIAAALSVMVDADPLSVGTGVTKWRMNKTAVS